MRIRALESMGVGVRNEGNVSMKTTTMDVSDLLSSMSGRGVEKQLSHLHGIDRADMNDAWAASPCVTILPLSNSRRFVQASNRAAIIAVR